LLLDFDALSAPEFVFAPVASYVLQEAASQQV
jgi:hypothetical protein